MNKKILLGSIIAVVILILVSFTGVVGYQTTKSSTITKASPLFSVRSKRAMGQGLKDISTDYLGHGEETNIPLTSRIRRAEQVQKTIDIISKMSDRAFSRFVERIILNLKYQEQSTDKETSDALQILHNIRENPNDVKYYDTKNNPIDETWEYVSCRWYLGCNIMKIIDKIIETILDIYWAIFAWIGIIIWEWITRQTTCNLIPTSCPGSCPS